MTAVLQAVDPACENANGTDGLDPAIPGLELCPAASPTEFGATFENDIMSDHSSRVIFSKETLSSFPLSMTAALPEYTHGMARHWSTSTNCEILKCMKIN